MGQWTYRSTYSCLCRYVASLTPRSCASGQHFVPLNICSPCNICIYGCFGVMSGNSRLKCRGGRRSTRQLRDMNSREYVLESQTKLTVSKKERMAWHTQWFLRKRLFKKRLNIFKKIVWTATRVSKCYRKFQTSWSLSSSRLATLKKKNRGLYPRANYTDRATAACLRSRYD
jgi:hypothetical protein